MKTNFQSYDILYKIEGTIQKWFWESLILVCSDGDIIQQQFYQGLPSFNIYYFLISVVFNPNQSFQLVPLLGQLDAYKAQPQLSWICVFPFL